MGHRVQMYKYGIIDAVIKRDFVQFSGLYAPSSIVPA